MKHRSVLEIMILIFSTVAGASIMLIGTGIAYLAFWHPEVDARGAQTAFIALLSTIVGALMGLVAGKSIEGKILSQRPGSEQGKETDDLPEGGHDRTDP